MAAVTFDDPTLNWPAELSNPENEPYRRIIERIVARIGGPQNDVIDSQSTSITTLEETIDELEEVIILIQKRTKTTISMLEQKVKCLEERLETN